MILNRYIYAIITAATTVAMILVVNTVTLTEDVYKDTADICYKELNYLPHLLASIEETTVQEIDSEEIETSQSEVETKAEKMYYTENDITDLSKLLLRECGGVQSKTEQACVVWCVLNRVDYNKSSIYKTLRESGQFAFSETTEVRADLYELAEDVLKRWNREKNGDADSGRVLPSEYLYFHGDGAHNYFRNGFSGNYSIWDYSLESPYEN